MSSLLSSTSSKAESRLLPEALRLTQWWWFSFVRDSKREVEQCPQNSVLRLSLWRWRWRRGAGLAKTHETQGKQVGPSKCHYKQRPYWTPLTPPTSTLWRGETKDGIIHRAVDQWRAGGRRRSVRGSGLFSLQQSLLFIWLIVNVLECFANSLFAVCLPYFTQGKRTLYVIKSRQTSANYYQIVSLPYSRHLFIGKCTWDNTKIFCFNF